MYWIRQTNSQSARFGNKCQHFISRDKARDVFYLYRGSSFDSEYELILMARFFKAKNEIRIYSAHDLGEGDGKTVLVSSLNKGRKPNESKAVQERSVPFDFEENHFAKVCINNPKAGTKETKKEFVIKSRHCLRCTRKPRYFC